MSTTFEGTMNDIMNDLNQLLNEQNRSRKSAPAVLAMIIITSIITTFLFFIYLIKGSVAIPIIVAVVLLAAFISSVKFKVNMVVLHNEIANMLSRIIFRKLVTHVKMDKFRIIIDFKDNNQYYCILHCDQDILPEIANHFYDVISYINNNIPNDYKLSGYITTNFKEVLDKYYKGAYIYQEQMSD